jgi:hypothetical protein
MPPRPMARRLGARLQGVAERGVLPAAVALPAVDGGARRGGEGPGAAAGAAGPPRVLGAPVPAPPGRPA